MKNALENYEFFKKYKCNFIPNSDDIVISDKENIFSLKIKANFISTIELSPRLVDQQNNLNFPFFFLPNRVEFLKKVIANLKKTKHILINGNSCVGKSHVGIIIYLYYLFQRENFRVIYVPFFADYKYLDDLFFRSFFTFYEEIIKSNELQIAFNLMSAETLKHTELQIMYKLLIEEARKNNKLILGIHDQLNNSDLKNNLSFKFLQKIELDKYVLISTSTDPNFQDLTRKDYNSGTRILLSISEDEYLNEKNQKSILKHYFNLKDDIKLNFLIEKTSSNFHILNEFRE